MLIELLQGRQVEVGTPGAPQQAGRDRLQREAMDLRANLSDAQGRLV